MASLSFSGQNLLIQRIVVQQHLHRKHTNVGAEEILIDYNIWRFGLECSPQTGERWLLKHTI